MLQGTGLTDWDGDPAQFTNLGLTTKLPTGGSGFIASLEAGYPVPLQFGPNFILEPQAQIIWQHVDFDQAGDGVGTIALGSTSGTTGRLGARGQWTIAGDHGEIWQPYARANLWHDWGGQAATSFGGAAVQVPLLEHATRLEFAGGVTLKFDPNFSFFAQAGYPVLRSAGPTISAATALRQGRSGATITPGDPTSAAKQLVKLLKGAPVKSPLSTHHSPSANPVRCW